jgi:hypothetical protein
MDSQKFEDLEVPDSEFFLNGGKVVDKIMAPLAEPSFPINAYGSSAEALPPFAKSFCDLFGIRGGDPSDVGIDMQPNNSHRRNKASDCHRHILLDVPFQFMILS